MGREKGRAAQGWQFYASVNGREGTGFPIKLPTRSGEGERGEVPNEGRKKRNRKKDKNKTTQNETRL